MSPDRQAEAIRQERARGRETMLAAVRARSLANLLASRRSFAATALHAPVRRPYRVRARGRRVARAGRRARVPGRSGAGDHDLAAGPGAAA
jgi:hypothetical protein